MEPAYPFSSLDDTGFEELYRLYWRRLYDFALSKTRDRDAAEEIVQELFAVLWERRKVLQITNIRNYLFTAVRNSVIDYYKQKLFADLDTAGEAAAPDYPLFLEELETALMEAVEGLNPKTREIFRLSRFDGKTVREISTLLQLPERTVEYHITQALRQLKTALRYGMFLLLSLIANSTF